jgi:hypothetical protein
MSLPEGFNVHKAPFNHDNFARLKDEVIELQDLVLKLTAKLAAQEDKPAPKARAKKSG